MLTLKLQLKADKMTKVQSVVLTLQTRKRAKQHLLGATAEHWIISHHVGLWYHV